MNEKWDRRFVELARFVARWSKDPSTQTGCVIVDDSKRVLSVGYNGFPAGVSDDPERYENRLKKYPMIAHADLNAIYTAARVGLRLTGATMYLTGPPCSECMKGIIQVGIHRVTWPSNNPFESDAATAARWAESLKLTFDMAKEAGVMLTRVFE